MRKLFSSAVLVVSLLCLSVQARAAEWFADEVAGPANNEIIVSTGAHAYFAGRCMVMVHSTLPGTFELQLRDTDGTTVLKKQKFSVVSGQVDISLDGPNIDISEGQYLVIVSKQALTLGTVTASIWL